MTCLATRRSRDGEVRPRGTHREQEHDAPLLWHSGPASGQRSPPSGKLSWSRDSALPSPTPFNERRMEAAGGFRARGIHFSIGPALRSVEPRGFTVPFASRNEVTDLVVGQAPDKLHFPWHHFA